jgi:uncharacterized protein (DUF1015 family)
MLLAPIMALVKPFAALRPRPELAARMCELPYDVVSAAEARALAAGNPYSFFHISKPEIDCPETLDPYDPQVYARGRVNFLEAIRQGWLVQDPSPCFYLYQLSQGTHRQVGLVAVTSCQDYLQRTIRPHELTHPDKVEDRRRHIETLEAQTGPAFLVYRAEAALDAFVAERTAQPPALDFTAPDGVRHTVWVVSDPEDIGWVEAAFQKVPRLYIADGHHRTEAAARLWQKRNGAGASAYFLAVLFPHTQVQILPYHRLVRDLNGLSADGFLQRLESVCVVQRSRRPDLAQPGQLGLYVQGQWHSLAWRPEQMTGPRQADTLTVSLLQRHVLGPVLGIEDPRTSQRIGFVGGRHGLDELVARVDRGEFACGFALAATRIQELMAVADAGELMPPKSTWFEPKLRDGLFCHLV